MGTVTAERGDTENSAFSVPEKPATWLAWQSIVLEGNSSVWKFSWKFEYCSLKLYLKLPKKSFQANKLKYSLLNNSEARSTFYDF